MWVEKSSDEIAIEHRSYVNMRAFIAFVVTFVLSSLLIKTGYDRWATKFHPIGWSDYVQKTPVIIGVSIVVFIMARLYFMRNPRETGAMCIKCEKIFPKGTMGFCECGGAVHPLLKLKWVEDNVKK